MDHRCEGIVCRVERYSGQDGMICAQDFICGEDVASWVRQSACFRVSLPGKSHSMHTMASMNNTACTSWEPALDFMSPSLSHR